MQESKVKICVDDFGLSPGIDTATLELASCGLIDAISVFTIYPHWQETLKKISPFSQTIEIGLHFCLTGTAHRPVVPVTSEVGYVCSRGFFLTPQRLFFQTLFGRIDQRAVKKELNAQHQRLISICGEARHIDSHHHCHQWRQISSAVVEFTKTQGNQPVLRQTTVPLRLLFQYFNFKFLGLTLVGGIFKYRLKKQKLKFNEYFGTYMNYSRFDKERWFSVISCANSLRRNILWSVHPSQNEREILPLDHLTVERVLEYECLISENYKHVVRDQKFSSHSEY